MFTKEQINQLMSANNSLQVQLDDINMVLGEREAEIEILKSLVSEDAALRSKLEGQMNEIEMIQDYLSERTQKSVGAEEREFELHQELTEAARNERQHDELTKKYNYLLLQFEDIQDQLNELSIKNKQLELSANRIGELESRISLLLLENEGVKTELTTIKSQKIIGGLKL